MLGAINLRPIKGRAWHNYGLYSYDYYLAVNRDYVQPAVSGHSIRDSI